MKNLLSSLVVVGVGGFLGSIARYSLSLLLKKSEPLTALPIDTLFVNICGSLVMGIIMALVLKNGLIPGRLALFVTVGFLGAFTTYSSFSYETLRLLQNAHYGWALLNAGLNLFGTMAAVTSGWWLGKIVLKYIPS